MHRTLIASFAMALLATPLLAAGAEPWPWKAKAPVDPALATLSHVDDVTAADRRFDPDHLGQGGSARRGL